MSPKPRTLTYRRGRYDQFLLVIEDEVRALPSGGEVYACRACGEAVEPPKRVYCSPACRKDFQRVFRMTDWWYIRDRAVSRDGGECQGCGASPVRRGWGQEVFLEVDHIRPVMERPSLEFDLENLRTLCRECHGETHSSRHRGRRVVLERERHRTLDEFTEVSP